MNTNTPTPYRTHCATSNRPPLRRSAAAVRVELLAPGLFALFFAAALGCEPSVTRAPVNSPSETPEIEPAEPISPADDPVEEAEEVDLISARDFFAEFEADEAAAREKYLGRRVRVSGWAGSINADMLEFGQPPAVLIAPEPIEEGVMWMVKPYLVCRILDKKPWETFSIRDPVLAEGKVQFEGKPYLIETKITAPEGKPAPKLMIEELAAEAEQDFKATEEKYGEVWVNATGRVIERAEAEEGGNPLLILYDSEKVRIQAEFRTNGSADSFAVGDAISLGDELTFLNLGDAGTSLIHFSYPVVHGKR